MAVLDFMKRPMLSWMAASASVLSSCCWFWPLSRCFFQLANLMGGVSLIGCLILRVGLPDLADSYHEARILVCGEVM